MTLTPSKMRAARAMLGLTQADLAVLSKTSTGSINDFETGKRKPRPATLTVWTQTFAAKGVALTDKGVEWAK